MTKTILSALCIVLAFAAVPSFAQEEVIGEGRRVEGLVCVLVSSAEGSTSTVECDSAARVNQKDWVLIRTPDGAVEEVHCIASIEESTLTLANTLVAAFPAGAQVLQGEPVGEALLGEVATNRTEGCEEPLAPWWKSTAFLIGAGAAGIVILNDVLEDDTTFQQDQEPASTFQP